MKMNKTKETYTEQVVRECRNDEIIVYFLIAFFPALIGYGVGQQLMMAFADNMWATVLVPIMFAIVFAGVAILMFYAYANMRSKSK
jgi:uncharacterized membrane protein